MEGGKKRKAPGGGRSHPGDANLLGRGATREKILADKGKAKLAWAQTRGNSGRPQSRKAARIDNMTSRRKKNYRRGTQARKKEGSHARERLASCPKKKKERTVGLTKIRGGGRVKGEWGCGKAEGKKAGRKRRIGQQRKKCECAHATASTKVWKEKDEFWTDVVTKGEGSRSATRGALRRNSNPTPKQNPHQTKKTYRIRGKKKNRCATDPNQGARAESLSGKKNGD